MLNTLTIDNKVLSYNDTLKFAKKIDPENFMDITHDFILDGGNFKSLKFKYKTSAVNDYTQIMETYNTCNICNEIKPAAMFNIIQAKGLKYLGNQCKECLKKKSYMWIKENSEKFRIIQLKYRAKHRNRIKLIQRKWYLNNRDYIKFYREDYYKHNREKILTQLKEKYKNDSKYRESRSKYNKQWSLSNSDKMRAYRKKYENSAKGIERKQKYMETNSEKIKENRKRYRNSEKGKEAKKRSNKIYAEKNYEKIKAYQKQYREKKKLEKLKKLHDHETTH